MPDLPNAFVKHDHATCSATLLARAQAIADERDLRLTPLRHRVLEILLEAHRAMGAYEVLDRLKEEGLGSQPPVAYRALDFLVENGLAHRIRRLNAFTACTTPEAEHAPLFLICETCEAVAELSGTQTAAALRGEAQQAGFDITRMNIEAVGTCRTCRDASHAPD